MACNKTDNMFYLYDGALSGEEREDAEIHLKRCAECRRAIAEKEE